MLETDASNLNAIEVKLRNLLNCILNKAANDRDFARQLEETLLTDSLRKTLAENRKQTRKHVFNAVEFLHVNGETKLRAELENKTDSELKQILRSEGIKKGKDLKSIERTQMVDEIVQNASRRLKQGSSFL